MKAILLGTGGYHPSETRHTACVMLPEVGVVLDAGTGFFRVRQHLATETLQVFLSHVHLDHTIGLTYLIDTVYGTSLSHVVVHAAPDVLAAVQAHLLSERLFPAPLPCQYESLKTATALPENGRLTAFPVLHPGGAYGFRLDWPGQSMAYVTDTTADPVAEYVQRINGVDVLLHECYFPDGWEDLARRTGHSCLSPVLQVAKTAGVGLLVLVHANPLGDEADPIGIKAAKKLFPATLLGSDGMEIEF